MVPFPEKPKSPLVEIRNAKHEIRNKYEISNAEFNEEVQRSDDSVREGCRNVALSLDDCLANAQCV